LGKGEGSSLETQANNFGGRQEENRAGPKGKVGAGSGVEQEGCLEPPNTISAMNPVALYFASGESLYLGAALLLLVIAVSPFARRTWSLHLRNVGHG
jgi:hypothetical protein